MSFADAYLARIGSPDPASLRDVHAAHLEHVPFENLDIALGRPVSLDPDALTAKIIDNRRGGFCYELNGMFGRLLAELGYDVTLLAAQVWTGERYSHPLDHMTLAVTDPTGTRWLCDVGFGRFIRHPLRLDVYTDQDDPEGTFRITAVDGDLVVAKDGVPECRIDPHPRRLEDFTAMCWYQQHSPDSHFTKSTVCSRPTRDGRVSLSEDQLIVTEHGEKTQTTLADDAAILAAYREHFGIVLDTVPRLATVTAAPVARSD